MLTPVNPHDPSRETNSWLRLGSADQQIRWFFYAMEHLYKKEDVPEMHRDQSGRMLIKSGLQIWKSAPVMKHDFVHGEIELNAPDVIGEEWGSVSLPDAAFQIAEEILHPLEEELPPRDWRLMLGYPAPGAVPVKHYLPLANARLLFYLWKTSGDPEGVTMVMNPGDLELAEGKYECALYNHFEPQINEAVTVIPWRQ